MKKKLNELDGENNSETGMIASVLKQDPSTHKRFRITLFTRTKHNMRIFGIIPFMKLQNDT